MSDRYPTDPEPNREKENMDEPQEEFISDEPPSKSKPLQPIQPEESGAREHGPSQE